MSQARCKGCGKLIEWIEIIEDTPGGPTTKRIPLDSRAPTYQLNGEKWARSSAYVSHFATCASANRFSASRSEPPAQPEPSVDDQGEKWWLR